MFLTVIVCTHNRADLLAGCLQALTQQTVPADAYEVVVVESACGDDTRDVTARFARHHAQVRVAREPRPGKSRALNAGLHLARGTHVACTDDDVRVPPTWLAQIAGAFAREPAPVVVAGAITGVYERPPPTWWHLLAQPQAPTPRYLSLGWDLYRVAGANLAFDRTALLQCGGFSTDHGPIGARYRLGEDSEAVRRVAARHPRVWYDPGIRVDHWVPAAHTTLAYLARRRFLSGVAISRIERTTLLSARSLRAAGARLGAALPGRRYGAGWDGRPARPAPGASLHGVARLRVSLLRLALLLAEKAGRLRGARLA